MGLHPTPNPLQSLGEWFSKAAESLSFSLNCVHLPRNPWKPGLFSLLLLYIVHGYVKSFHGCCVWRQCDGCWRDWCFPSCWLCCPGNLQRLECIPLYKSMLYISHACKFISNLFMTQRKWKLYWNNNKKVHTIGSRAPDIKHKFLCKWQKPWDSRKIKMAFNM